MYYTEENCMVFSISMFDLFVQKKICKGSKKERPGLIIQLSSAVPTTIQDNFKID